MEKIELETTKEMRVMKKLLDLLDDNLPKIISNSFFKKSVKIEDKIKYIQKIAETKGLLWELVYTKYPQTIGKNCSMGEKYITFEIIN